MDPQGRPILTATIDGTGRLKFMQQWEHPNPLVRLAAIVYVLRGRLGGILSESYQDSAISPLEGSTLSVIASPSGPVTVPQIARILGYTRQAVQGAVASLSSSGLVRSAKNPNHKRSVLFHPTEAGLEVLNISAERANTLANPVMNLLNQTEVEKTVDDLWTLLSRIDAAIAKCDEAEG